ncbi:hypothetical protein ACLOJK_008133 [Asimina triloba]
MGVKNRQTWVLGLALMMGLVLLSHSNVVESAPAGDDASINSSDSDETYVPNKPYEPEKANPYRRGCQKFFGCRENRPTN